MHNIATAVVLVHAVAVVALPVCIERPDELLDAEGVPTHQNPIGYTSKTGQFVSYVFGDFGVDLEANVPPGEYRPDFNVARRDAVAAAMKARTGMTPPNHVINVGDSFYQDGLQSAEDPRWETTFENTFTEPSDVYFHSVMGNHDWYGNVYTRNGTEFTDDAGIVAQLNYTVQNAKNRWCAPDLNYTFDVSLATGAGIRYIFIDTQSMKATDEGSCNGGGCRPRDKADWDKVSRNCKNCRGKVVYPTRTQLDWIETLACEKKDKSLSRTIVVGHHPMVTAGTRLRSSNPIVTSAFVDSAVVDYRKTHNQSETDAFESKMRSDFLYDPNNSFKEDLTSDLLLPIFEKCGVDMYISGHEHMSMVSTHKYSNSSVDHLLHITFGDSGKANLENLLDDPPTKTACEITGCCFCNATYFQKTFGPSWELLWSDHTGAFAEVILDKDAVLVRAIGAATETKYEKSFLYSEEDRGGSFHARYVIILAAVLGLLALSLCFLCSKNFPGKTEPNTMHELEIPSDIDLSDEEAELQ